MIRCKTSLASALALALAACAGPQITQPAPLRPPPSAWSVNNAMTEEEPRLDWWTELGDPELDRLVTLALHNNADLRAATANLAATGELVRETQAVRRPVGGLEASASHSRTAGASLQLDTVGGPAVLPSQTLVDAGISLSWEIDFAGRLAAMGDAAAARFVQESWLRRGVEASVAISVVRAWADLADSDARLALQHERAALLADAVARISRAQDLGGLRHDNLIEAQRALAATEAERPVIEAARRNALRRLATLTGTPAPTGVQSLATIRPTMLPVPQFVRAGRPERILRMRPDVAAAEQELVQAMANVQVARADLYPRISLLGSVGISAVPDRLTDTGALRFGIGPMISWGLFDMDRIRARIRSEGAVAEAAGARWESAFMKALEETDAALDVFAAASRTAAAAYDDQTRAAQLADLARVRRTAGQANYLTELTRNHERMKAAGEALHANHNMLAAWINVQAALGAGWRP